MLCIFVPRTSGLCLPIVFPADLIKLVWLTNNEIDVLFFFPLLFLRTTLLEKLMPWRAWKWLTPLGYFWPDWEWFWQLNYRQLSLPHHSSCWYGLFNIEIKISITGDKAYSYFTVSMVNYLLCPVKWSIVKLQLSMVLNSCFSGRK